MNISLLANPLRDVFNIVTGFFYPPLCVKCSATLLGARAFFLCPECTEEIDYINTGACKLCGAASGAGATHNKGCARCKSGVINFTRAVGVAKYHSPVRDLIHDFKFYGNRRLAKTFAQMMTNRIKELGIDRGIDYVLPVPLHPTREKWRGYNQAALLGKYIAREIKSPFSSKKIFRVRKTESQALLTNNQRLLNLSGAFKAEGIVEGAKILLIDDVLTTGATASECAKALRDAGASRVYVAVFAR